MKKAHSYCMAILSRPGLLFLLAFFFFLSCNQDPVFYNISIEPEPREPLIKGSPTNMVVMNNEVYVASRMGNTIYRFTGTVWVPLPAGGAVGGIAGSGDFLYVLVFPSGDPRDSSLIKKYDGTDWAPEEYSLEDYSIQSIYAAGDNVFAGVQLLSDYQENAIMRLGPGASSLVEVSSGLSPLTGAAFSSLGTFLSTGRGAKEGIPESGIFRFSGTSLTPVLTSANIVGIIDVNGVITAVTSGGDVYFSDTGSSFPDPLETGIYLTGAMSVWKRYSESRGWESSLLLLGAGGRSTTLGYREMVLHGGRPTKDSLFHSPGESGEGTPSSVENKDKYKASLGKHPVEEILQVPDGVVEYIDDPLFEPPIFAATSLNGLWSYREGQWNAEE